MLLPFRRRSGLHRLWPLWSLSSRVGQVLSKCSAACWFETADPDPFSGPPGREKSTFATWGASCPVRFACACLTKTTVNKLHKLNKVWWPLFIFSSNPKCKSNSSWGQCGVSNGFNKGGASVDVSDLVIEPELDGSAKHNSQKQWEWDQIGFYNK